MAQEVGDGLDFLMNSHSKLAGHLLLAHLVLCTLCKSPQEKGRLDFLGAGEEAVSAPPPPFSSVSVGLYTGLYKVGRKHEQLHCIIFLYPWLKSSVPTFY